MSLQPKPIIENIESIYNELKQHKTAVYYSFTDPIVLINDPDLIKEITVKAFDHFVDRTTEENGKLATRITPEASKMLTTLMGEEWKVMRAAVSPTFTTGKLKHLVGAINRAGPGFKTYIDGLLEEKRKKGEEEALAMKDLFARYATGVIAEAVYGIDARVFDIKEESEFVKQGTALQSKFTFSIIIKFICFMVFPQIFDWFKIRFVSKAPFSFFFSISDRLLADRKAKGERGNDMLQYFQDIHDGKDLKGASTSEETGQFEKDAALNVKVNKAEMMTDEGVRQCALLFFLGGFDTTSSTLSMVAYYLATHQDVQERVRDEIDALDADLNGADLRYEDVNKLEYLESVIYETTRISGVAVIIERVCTKDYTLSTGLHIPKDTRVHFYSGGLHKDPQYFENPEQFNPDRFSRENRHKINPYTYLAFGAGPRNCIGMRFAIMEMKVAIFHLLRSFILEPSSKTPIPIKYEKAYVMTTIVDGNTIKLTPRN